MVSRIQEGGAGGPAGSSAKRTLGKKVVKMLKDEGIKNPAKFIARGMKKGRAASAEQLGIKKPMSTGMRKVQTKIIKNDKEGRIIGSPIISTKGGKYTVKEYMTQKKVTGKGKDVMNNARDVERKAGVVKKVEPLRYAKAKDKRKTSYTANPITPRVPVKPKKK